MELTKRPVVTKYGKYLGIQKEECRAYLGIPYAKAPVGELRFAAPQKPDVSEDIVKADHFGNRCMQGGSDPFYGKEFYSVPEFMPPVSEDCLYLNIWTPDGADENAHLPVGFYIHGGAFMGGAGSEMEFDGEAYARRSVILVTINYRCGIFGFLAHPWLAQESENGLCGNYGTLDQIAALTWVRENIAAFGGDPENITIFGQSAGAMSVQTLCSSRLTDGMFARAILQSGGSYGVGLHSDVPMKEAMQDGAAIVEGMNIHSLQELKDVPAQELMTKFDAYMHKRIEEAGGFQNVRLPMIPCIDGCVLEQGYYETMDQGKLHNIPYMLGSNSEDIGCVSKEEQAAGKFGMLYNGVLAFAAKEEEVQNNPPYVYYFTRQMPGDDAGAFHSSELWYVFGTLGRCWRPLTDGDFALSNRMLDCWTGFMKNGDPGADWHKCTADDPFIMRFDV
ncbi:MAG: carboxylesterase family protein [Lachnospiraceae bacterium]|nr:carboxylesterase family protein [Lachnospiraceae bacterium]